MKELRDKLKLEYVVQQPLPRNQLQWCEMEVKDQPSGWRQRRGYGNNCQRHAIYKIGEHYLCRIHAGAMLLDILMKDHPTHYYLVSNTPRLQRKPT